MTAAEKKDKKRNLPYMIPVLCASVQWLIWQFLRIGNGFLEYDISRPYTWIQKAFFLCFLISAWCFAFYVIRQYRAGNDKIRRGVKIFELYFLILFAILILLWPGTWQWDDIGVLASARYYDVLPWQHVLSSFFQTVFLQLIPTPGGIILIQLVTAAVIVSYSLTDFEATFFDGKPSIQYWIIDTLIKLIPFLLPPVILYQYSGFRMGMYIFYEVFVLSFIICISYRSRTISPQMLVFFALCTAVISTWRSEGLLYAPVVIILILIQDNKMLSIRKKLFTVGVIITGIAAITSFQKFMTEDDNYSIVAFLRPLSEVVRAADPIEDAELLADIDKVITMEPIYEYPDVNGEDLLWKYDLNIKEYTDEEYSSFFKAFLELCRRHPKAVAKERIKVFVDTSAIHGRTNPTNVTVTYYLFDPAEQNINQQDFVSWDAPFNRPVSESLRQSLILFLGALREDFSEMPIYRLVWDTIIPLGILIVLWFYLLIKKELKLLLGLSAVVFRIPIVFLTAPATWTMYYLSFYLIGYIALMWILQYVVGSKKRKSR